MLKIDGITRRFGEVTALDGVSLEIGQGEFFALLGPSGCGKTTLLRIIAGFERPDAGTVTLDGEDLLGKQPNRRPISLMFQSYALFPHMSVHKNVAYGLEQEKLPRQEIKERVGEVLETVGLAAHAGRRPHQLSGGQRQRVALARSIVKRPRLLLLDEPLSALDKKVRADMQLELKRLQHEVGITFVVVTHDQEEAMSLADRIAVFDSGRVCQVDEPVALYERPRTPFVADFVGANNLFEGTYERGGAAEAVRDAADAADAADAEGASGATGAEDAQGAREAGAAEGAPDAADAQGAQGTDDAGNAAGAVNAGGVPDAAGAEGAQDADGADETEGTEGAQAVQDAQDAQDGEDASDAEDPQGAEDPRGADAQGAEDAPGADGAEDVQGASGAEGVDGAEDAGSVAGAVRAGEFGALPGTPLEELEPGAAVLLAVRPEKVRLDEPGTPHALKGTVLDVSFYGGVSHISVSVPGRDKPVLAAVQGAATVRPGAEVTLGWWPGDAIILPQDR